MLAIPHRQGQLAEGRFYNIIINQDFVPHLRHLRDIRGGGQEDVQLGVKYAEGDVNGDDQGVNTGRSGYFSLP